MIRHLFLGTLLAGLEILGAQTALASPAMAQAAPSGSAWSIRGADGSSVVTHGGSLALALEALETPHPEVPAAGVHLTMRAVLFGVPELEAQGDLRFVLEIYGARATLRAGRAGEQYAVSNDGRTRGTTRTAPTPWIPRAQAGIPIELEVTRHGAERFHVRVLWEGRGTGSSFPLEPLPPRALRVSASDVAGVLHGLKVRRGRGLFQEFACGSCHSGALESAVDPGALGALGAPGAPGLSGIGRRMNVNVLTAWILDPQGHDASTHMPDLFDESMPSRADAFLLAQLLAQNDVPLRAGAQGDIDEGRRTFHERGCVACHGPLESPLTVFGIDYYTDELPAAPAVRQLPALGSRWTEGTLTAFLQQPETWRPSGRMPELGLDQVAARNIAAYLLAQLPGTVRAADASATQITPAAAARAADVWRSKGCGACHAAQPELGLEGAPPATPLDRLRAGHGCLDSADPGSPRFSLLDSEREALALALPSLARARPEHAPLEASRQAFAALNCSACHRRGGLGGLTGERKELTPYFVCVEEETELGDEGRLPPHLDQAGLRLTSSWMRRVSSEGASARSYMGTRMPQFRGAALPRLEAIVRGFAQADGLFADMESMEPEVDAQRVSVGLQLLGRRGLACISCHVVGDRPPAGTAGLDLTQMAERLRFEGFRHLMHGPARYKPGTRMPDFLIDGRNGFAFYGGDGDRQIEAIWSVLGQGESMPIPAGVPDPAAARIEVAGHPTIFRTFLPGAGARGIAVGLPIGLHYAFDAERCFVTDVWRGEFMTSSSTWSGRGGGVAGGQGPSLWKAGEASFSLAGGETLFDFRGYRVGRDKQPVFHYKLVDDQGEARVSIRERFVAYPEVVADTPGDSQISFARVYMLAAVSTSPIEVDFQLSAGERVLSGWDGATVSGLGEGRWRLTFSDSVTLHVGVTP